MIGFLSFGGETLSALQVTPSRSGREIRRSREISLRFEAGDAFAQSRKGAFQRL